MESELVDKEGFPRSDIDVYAIRHARLNIIRLRNDLHDVTQTLHSALLRLHQGRTVATPTPQQLNAQATHSEKETLHPTPFALIDAVAPDSPAASAGLLINDKLLKFGPIHSGNHEKLSALAHAQR